MAIKTSRFAAVDNTPKSRDLIRCLCSFSGDLPACSLSVSAVGGRAEALTRWFPTRRYWGASGCRWIWSWAIFQCSECHVLSPWTPRWKWATTTWVDKPWVAHGRGALIQRYRVILRGGRGALLLLRDGPLSWSSYGNKSTQISEVWVCYATLHLWGFGKRWSSLTSS